MDSYSFSERMVYDNRIRISEIDRMTASILHQQACINTPKGKNRPRFEDFLPNRGRRNLSKVKPSSECAAAFAAAYGPKAPGG